MPSLRRLAALALLPVAAACMPAVAHGPRVEPGLQGGVTASLPFGPRYGTGDWGDQPFLFGPAGVNLGYGWGSGRPEKPAVYLGTHVPVPAFPAVQADLYVQAPPRALGAFDGGLGVNASAFHVAPYLQLGLLGEGGSGLYTVQSVDFLLQRNETYSNDLYGRLWVGTLAYELRGRKTSTHLFASLGYGWHAEQCVYDCLPAERRSVAAAGVTFSARRAAPPRPVLP